LGRVVCAGLRLADIWEEVAGGEQRFSEVAAYDFFRLAYAREIHAGIPAEQYIDICRYIYQLGRGQNCRFLATLGMTIVD
jgi:hypothetical protein